MSKYCRDPSDLFIGRRVFTGKCDCKCTNTSMGLMGDQCNDCGHVQRGSRKK